MVSKYLSMDIESTGLEETSHLLQIAFVPLDSERVHNELAKLFVVKCPSFESLKPEMSTWVIEHNKEIIEDAHANGIDPNELPGKLESYLESDPIRDFFGGHRPIMLGKSMNALDMPLMARYLSFPFIRKHFHHHTLDLTGVGHCLTDSGILPPGHASGSNLVSYYQVSEEISHTAMDDACDMAEIYVRILRHLKGLATTSELSQNLENDNP